jgi:hypothetical protein
MKPQISNLIKFTNKNQFATLGQALCLKYLSVRKKNILKY